MHPNHSHYRNAKTNSENTYAGNNYVQSGLITGTQWDTTMKWLELSGVDISSDPTSWGRYVGVRTEGVYFTYDPESNTGTDWTYGYATSGVVLTGATPHTRKNNIYDLAGNLGEFTTEVDFSPNIVLDRLYSFRGGSYKPYSNRLPTYRDYTTMPGTYIWWAHIRFSHDPIH